MPKYKNGAGRRFILNKEKFDLVFSFYIIKISGYRIGLIDMIKQKLKKSLDNQDGYIEVNVLILLKLYR